MLTAEMFIRRATADDIAAIWRLLHCEGRDMSDEAIAGKLPELYLLYQGTKLIGVYDSGQRPGEAGWASVHPLYSQGLVEEIMVKAVNGLFKDIFNHRCGVNAWISRSTKKPSSRFISSLRSRLDIFC